MTQLLSRQWTAEEDARLLALPGGAHFDRTPQGREQAGALADELGRTLFELSSRRGWLRRRLREEARTR